MFEHFTNDIGVKGGQLSCLSFMCASNEYQGSVRDLWTIISESEILAVGVRPSGTQGFGLILGLYVVIFHVIFLFPGSQKTRGYIFRHATVQLCCKQKVLPNWNCWGFHCTCHLLCLLNCLFVCFLFLIFVFFRGWG